MPPRTGIFQTVRKVVVGLDMSVAFLAAVRAQAAEDPANDLFSPAVAEQLNYTIEAIMRSNNLPSVGVDMSIPEKGSYVFVGGVANRRTGERRRYEQPFRIASLIKTFLATALLQLVDHGELQKSDVLATWFPDFPNAGKITVDDLLRIRSGIAASSDEEIIDEIYHHPTARASTLAELIAQSVALRDQFIPPDQEGVYTDLNYFILDGIVEKITGHDVGFLIKKHIIRPLRLRHTTFPVDVGLPGRLQGYGLNTATQELVDKTEFNPALGGAAGAMNLSLADLRR